MSSIKRIIVIMALIIASMLVFPLVAINTVKADAGMLVTLLLFFTVYPIISVCVGIISGKDIKHLWFTPILIAVLFWIFSSLTYQTAFPIVYSTIYFMVCYISMLITWVVAKRE